MILRPDKAAIEVIIIGHKNQARGILKYSAIIALGKEIIKTVINLNENTCFAFLKDLNSCLIIY